jgi:hypothetical protein
MTIPSAGARRATSPALEALVAGLIDYAGLFPPAALAMSDAVSRYDAYRRGAHRFMLGRFVVPIARLEEFRQSATPLLRAGDPWRLSVLGGGGDREVIERFNVACAGRAIIDALEGKADLARDVAQFESCASLVTPDGTPFVTYVEIPLATDPEPLLAAIADLGLRAKVRTGGVTPDAFPSAAQLAAFLSACAAHDVAFKASAGLHHPFRGDYAMTYDAGSVRAPMFGFVNVFVGALFLRSGLSESRVAALLEERDPRAVSFDAAGVTWSGHRLDHAAVRLFRERFASSFGSCSFTEPVEELTSLRLL